MLLFVGLLACQAGAALAANDGRADPALLLGPVQTYPTPDSARRACKDDQVVWADRYDGFYYGGDEGRYAATRDGSYACEAEARRGGYWSTDPRSGMEGHRGRSFPFDPIFVGS